MKNLIGLLIFPLLMSCNMSQYRGNNIVHHQPTTTKQKIQGEWKADKVVYDFGLIDNDPKRSFVFDLHGFFKVNYFYKDQWRVKNNFYAVEKDQIHLINRETMEVYEIAEVIEVSRTTLVLSTISPKENKYSVHMTR